MESNERKENPKTFMNIICRVVLFSSIIYISCSNSPGKGNLSTETANTDNITINNIGFEKNAYDDIDLFDLKGIKKIGDSVNYPCIKIEAPNEFERNIIFKRSKEDSSVETYNKENNYWSTSYVSREDTGYYKVYKYVTPQKIIEIGYSGTWQKTNFHLSDITVHEKNKIVTYTIHGYGKPAIVVQPAVDLLERFKNKTDRIWTDEYSTTDGILKIMTNGYDVIKKQIYFRDTTCYLTRNHSWFWWAHFGSNKVNCK
jgi:hypothetical protein